MPNRFRFNAPMPRLRGEARVGCRKSVVGGVGFNTVAVSEHVTQGWQLSPVAAMASSLRMFPDSRAEFEAR